MLKRISSEIKEEFETLPHYYNGEFFADLNQLEHLNLRIKIRDENLKGFEVQVEDDCDEKIFIKFLDDGILDYNNWDRLKFFYYQALPKTINIRKYQIYNDKNNNIT